MEELIDYFSDIPRAHRTIILVGGLMFFWMIEGIIPIVSFRYKKLKHALINLFFTATTTIVNFGFAYLIVRSSDAAVSGGWGILNWIDMPLWATILIGLLIMDLIGAYLIHWLQHKIHWMWKFHVIHHSDENVDATTALRHHPGESVFRAVFTLLAVLITGAPMWLVMVYQSLSAFLSQFNHSNVRLPNWINRTVGRLIITPNMHRVHHHAELPYTDANYGNIFPYWDYIFGTYAMLDTKDIEYGLDVFDKDHDSIGDLLGLPFDGRTYRQDK